MDDDTLEDGLQYTKIQEDLDKQFIGTYLYRVLRVESYLDALIGWFFFPKDSNAQRKLVGHIINDINFNKKIGIFLKLLRDYNNEVFKKHPNLKRDFEKVRKLRNQLVHSMLDTSLDYIMTKPTNLRLLIWNGDKILHKDFSMKEMEEKTKEVRELFKELIQIHEELTGEKLHGVF